MKHVKTTVSIQKDIMQYNIVSKMREAASRNPSSPAFIYQNQLITYGQLDSYVRSAARIFHGRGIKPGDAVVLLMMQSPVYCIAMLALADIGAVSVPLNPAASADAKENIRKRYGVKAVVSDLDDAEINGVPLIKLVNLTIDSHGGDMSFTNHQPTAETPFCIAMSSGTTGDPKGILYTHRYLQDMIDEAQFDLSADTRLVPLAMHIAFGFCFAIGVLTKGGTLVFTVGPLQDLGAFINLYAVTHLVFPPSLIAKFLPFVPEGGNPFPSLRRLRVGGSGSSTKLIGALCAKFPNNIEIVYGLTELGAVSVAKPDILALSPMSSGKIIPRFKLEVVDDKEQVVPSGIAGEIRVILNGMPAGYYRDEKNTQLRFRDGWYYTGDVGRVSEGLLLIDGRIDDIISIGGNKVSPGYVEEILTRHPGVSEAVVFCTKAENGNEVLAAAVIFSGGGAEQELAEYSKTNLGLASPQKFFPMREFPRNASGKVLRQNIVSAALEMDALAN